MIIKKTYLSFLFLVSFQIVLSQDFNQWINTEKLYLKIGVNEDGLYRITYDDLSDESLNFNILIRDPRLFQMYYRGEQIAIHVSGAEDGLFDEGDYIEFLGKKNDGTLDAQMYDSSDSQTNPYRNLYSNMSYYFLTFRIDDDEEIKRIPNITVADTGLDAESYHINTEIRHFFADSTSEYTSKFSKFTSGPLFPTNEVRLTNISALYSGWNVGKGHTDIPFAGNGIKIDYGVSVKNFFLGGILPHIEVRLTGRNNTEHNIDLFVGPTLSNQRFIKNFDFDNYRNVVYNSDLEVVDLQNNENDSIYVSYVINKQNADPDRDEYVSISAITLRFAQTFDIAGESRKIFELHKPATELAKVIIENVPTGTATRLFDITDETNLIQIESSISGTDLTANLPTILSGDNRKLLLESETKSINTIETVPLFEIKPQDFNYIIITHNSLKDGADEYATYRSSEEGGSNNVLTIRVDNIYAQFSYGEVTPLGIRKFLEFMIQNGNPEFLFLIGKGLDIENEYENNKDDPKFNVHKSLVPCYGKPCSDNAFTQGLQGTTSPYEPYISTGRLAAVSNGQVINYLNKVIEHEAFEYDDLWKKRILHLSGGKTELEINRFKNFVNFYGSIATDHYLGGRITTISKETTANTEIIDISDEVTKGVGLITFFGHSSLSIADIEFGLVSEESEQFENKGKYPMLIVNGCNAGNIFSIGESVGEDWMLTADKGAILYLAHSHLGFATPQNEYSKSVYRFLFSDSTLIHQPIGNVLQQHYKSYLGNLVANIDKSQISVQQFVLQGDPAIRLYNMPKPDYFIDDNEISVNENFIEEKLTAQIDSFELNIVVSNYGRTTPDPIDFHITRTFPDGSFTTYGPIQISSPLFKDTISYVIHNSEQDKERGIGINNFKIEIDYQDRVEELNEVNNEGQFNFFFPRGSMVFISPKDYSIVSQQPVTLFAQNTDPEANNRDYEFELDTTRSFSSGFLKKSVIRADLVPKWTTSLISDNDIDSLVYYARVRLKDVTAQEDTSWTEISFLYKANSPNGWSQSHNEQLRQNSISNLVYDQDKRRFDYLVDTIRIKAKTLGGFDEIDYFIEIDGDRVVENGECSNLGVIGQDIIMLIAFDQFTGVPYVTQRLKVPIGGGQGGDKELYCGFGEPGIAAAIDSDLVQGTAEGLNDFIDGFDPADAPPVEGVRDGDYILLMSSGGFRFDDVQAKIYQFEKMGILGSNISLLHDGYPYIAFGRKGFDPGTAIEILPDFGPGLPPIFQNIQGEFEIILNHKFGTLVSPRIGPAKNWSNLYNFHNKETESVTSDVTVYGINSTGNTEILFENETQKIKDISAINAAEYPYLRLQSNLYDSVSIPRQIDSWGITYEEVPEGILFFDSLTASLTSEVSIQEGDSIHYFFRFENVTSSEFEEELIVRYEVQNLETQLKNTYFDTLQVLTGNDTLKFETKYPTLGLVGRNKITVNINPILQSEQLYDNNILELNFNVEKDETNPILDVVFDGTHILDGDIVSPNPLITITLLDENNFLLREDTVGIKILIKDCPECDFERVAFNSPDITYGRSKSNTFQIDYNPKNLEDNMYTLNVIAEDLSGNQSGIEPFEINFQVINESKITHFYPYPNPFSESVRFVFTLTGGVVPNQIKIQIMTVTGRVVREILQDEIGPVKIGNNITSYAWDGKDEFGDQLANGVYLYRVIVQSDGEGFERLETSSDNLFKKGFGKMYLLR